MLLKEKVAYQQWLKLHRDLPKTERFGLGARIDSNFLDLLEYTFTGSYLVPLEKIPLLGKAIERTEKVKFFLQITWENNLLTSEQYSGLVKELEEIGRQLGAWRKGLLAKTPRL